MHLVPLISYYSVMKKCDKGLFINYVKQIGEEGGIYIIVTPTLRWCYDDINCKQHGNFTGGGREGNLGRISHR